MQERTRDSIRMLSIIVENLLRDLLTDRNQIEESFGKYKTHDMINGCVALMNAMELPSLDQQQEQEMTDIDKKISRALNTLMLAGGATSRGIARALKLNENDILCYRKGLKRIPTNELFKIADYLDKDITFFYNCKEGV